MFTVNLLELYRGLIIFAHLGSFFYGEERVKKGNKLKPNVSASERVRVLCCCDRFNGLFRRRNVLLAPDTKKMAKRMEPFFSRLFVPFNIEKRDRIASF